MRFKDKLIENLDFGRSGLKLMKLACCFDVIGHSNQFSSLCNDQLVNLFWKINKWIKFFLVFLLETLCSSQFCEIELILNLIYCLSSCIMSFNLLMHHLCLGFTCIALFLYPSCSFAVISLIVFTHNMYTLCYIGYSTWSKIDWLIFELCTF